MSIEIAQVLTTSTMSSISNTQSTIITTSTNTKLQNLNYEQSEGSKKSWFVSKKKEN
jgi:hypothetical protein